MYPHKSIRDALSKSSLQKALEKKRVRNKFKNKNKNSLIKKMVKNLEKSLTTKARQCHDEDLFQWYRLLGVDASQENISISIVQKIEPPLTENQVREKLKILHNITQGIHYCQFVNSDKRATLIV